MGLDVYGGLVLAIPVERAEFWQVTGTAWKCARCLREGDKNAKCCSECGWKLSKIAVEEPTPNFLAFAGSRDPKEIWEALSRDDDDDEMVCLRRIDAIQGCDDDVVSLGLGVRLLQTDSHRSGEAEPVSVAPDDIDERMTAIRAVADALGIDASRMPEFYLYVYLSY